MKGLGSLESMEALMSICPTTEEKSNHGYKKMEFQSMIMEGMDEEEQMSEKKRRLGADQVKALEKNFEMENKLEPERKVKLAQEIGLQPRQVAVWFQNRRARWKTKQLERDYGLLKANFDSLKHNYDSLRHHNDSLNKEITELKSKLYNENEANEKAKSPETSADDDATDMIYGGGENIIALSNYFPDGPSDSDSSAILNEEINSSNATASHRVTATTAVAEMNCYQLPESKAIIAENVYQPQFVKIEEFNFFSGDESCNFFSEDQAPTLPWYCQDEWKVTDDN